MDEPRVTINGQVLTEAQAMTLRVAVQQFLFDLRDAEALRDLGPIGPLYRERLLEIQRVMSREAS